MAHITHSSMRVCCFFSLSIRIQLNIGAVFFYTLYTILSILLKYIPLLFHLFITITFFYKFCICTTKNIKNIFIFICSFFFHIFLINMYDLVFAM